MVAVALNPVMEKKSASASLQFVTQDGTSGGTSLQAERPFKPLRAAYWAIRFFQMTS